MFKSERVGGYIALLRKHRGMTQSQLSERLAVSHQAVSNWERGESMPDISLLIQLASALQVSVDQLLRAGTVLEESELTADGHFEQTYGEEERKISEQATEKEKKGIQQPGETAARPTCQEKQFERVQKDGSASWEKIISLAPFLSREKLNELVQRVMARGDKAGWELAENLAPFLGKETLDELIDRIEEQADYKRLEDLAPFLSREKLNELVQRAMARGEEAGWELVENLAPFLSREVLDQLATELWKKTED